MEIILKVLELGADAEILSPESCRAHMRDIVGQIAKQYAE